MNKLSDLELHASGLISKWGFSDGDLVCDYLHYLEDEGFSIPECYHQNLLIHLVKKYLLPELAKRGILYEVEEVGTIHNPIRSYKVNGEEVDMYNPGYSHPALDGVSVSLSAELVLSEAENVKDTLSLGIEDE